jgi:uncharacterized SAM-binding protein YcdF (DUF218 family)
MFFILSKLLTVLIMPMSLIIIAFLLSFLIKKRRKQLQVLAISLLFFFSNPLISSLAMKWWEVPPIVIESITKPYKIGVVLCGVTNPHQKPDDRVHFNSGADRIIHAVQLYKMGKIKKILITGGSGSLLYPEDSESQDLYDFCMIAGVRKKDILLENKSRNTHENAMYSKKIIEREKVKEKVLLITSASHMRRSMACFAKEKIKLDPFTTDNSSAEFEFTPNRLIIPSDGSIGAWGTLFKEWLGMVAYKLMGYI